MKKEVMPPKSQTCLRAKYARPREGAAGLVLGLLTLATIVGLLIEISTLSH